MEPALIWSALAPRGTGRLNRSECNSASTKPEPVVGGLVFKSCHKDNSQGSLASISSTRERMQTWCIEEAANVNSGNGL